jgi:hypothetical protein
MPSEAFFATNQQISQVLGMKPFRIGTPKITPSNDLHQAADIVAATKTMECYFEDDDDSDNDAGLDAPLYFNLSDPNRIK